MIKDWKLYSIFSSAGEWYGAHDKYSYVKVWKIGLSSKERKAREIGAYGFQARIGRDGSPIEKYYFKTKQQVMKFAKAWMRKHHD